jgi:hypothetical protein
MLKLTCFKAGIPDLAGLFRRARKPVTVLRGTQRFKSREQENKAMKFIHAVFAACVIARQLLRLRAASVRSRSALSRMKPAASFWSYAPRSSSKVTSASE